MRGWILCKLRAEGSTPYDDLAKFSNANDSTTNSSLSQRVYDLSYGILSQKEEPPSSGWVFLAKDSSSTTVAKCFTQDEMLLAPMQPIRLDLIHIDDDSILHREGLDGYMVSNSPIAAINGTYLKAGVFDGVFMYAHVRGWVILRGQFPEIPELGITTADIEDNEEGFNKFFNRADAAFNDIVDTSNPIAEGSSDFTRKFIEIARAGNKMITADQTIQNIYNSDRKIALQSQSSIDMANVLDKMRSTFTTSRLQNQVNTTSLTPSPTNKQEEHQDKPNNIKQLLDVDLNMVLTKKISYQSTNTALAPHILHNSMPSRDVSTAWSAEAELSAEIIACVERREAIYKQILSTAQEMQRLYLEYGIEYAKLKLEEYEDLLQELRSATLDFAEAYGAWARIIIKQQAIADKKGKRKVTKKYSHEPDPRTYCVVIAIKSVNELYPASQEMQSSMKKFCRGFEPGLKGIESKFVGEFKTEREAIEALNEAFLHMPSERWVETDINAERKAMVGFRPCGKHFIVRSSAVPLDLPCETCGTVQAANTDTIAPKLYNFINGFPVFSYSNLNYIEKIWKDLNALNNIDVMKKLFPAMETFKNPFLLENSTRSQLLQAMLRKDATTKERQSKPPDPLGSLKGRMEILQDALLYSKTYQSDMEEAERRKKAKNHPYFKTQQVSKIFDATDQGTDNPSKRQRNNRNNAKGLLASASVSKLESLKHNVTITPSSEINGVKAERYISALKALSQILGSEYATETKEEGKEESVVRTSHSAPSSSAKTSSLNSSTMADQMRSTSYDLPGIAMEEDEEEDEEYRDNIDLDSLPVEPVTAIFSDRGADLLLSSTRPLPAYREDDKFCRTDVGEFANFTKGRSVRQFVYQQETYKEGKIKEKRRKQLQAQLRHAVQQRYTAAHIEYTSLLIEKAKAIRGSVLQLDIIQAENYLLKYHSMIRYSIMVQCMYRGNKDRMLFYRLREQYVRDQIRRKYNHIFAYNMAKQIIPELINEQVKNEKRYRTKPLYSVVINMSGFYTVVSIYRAGRQMRKPTDSLCLSCQTHSVTYYAHNDILNMSSSTIDVKKYASKYHSKSSPEHLKDLRENDDMFKHVNHINFKDKPDAERKPCTCRMLEEVERWRVTFYFPLERKTICKMYNMQDIVKLLVFIEGAKFMQSPAYAYQALIGESFDLLTPLFGINPHKDENSSSESTNINCSMSYAKAWLTAAKESSVLPRLLSSLSGDMKDVLDKYAGSNGNEEVKYIVNEPKHFGMVSYLDKYKAKDISGQLNAQALIAHNYSNTMSSLYGDVSVNAAEGGEGGKTSVSFLDQWQPLWEMERMKLIIKQLRVTLADQENNLKVAISKLDSRQDDYDNAVIAFEHANMIHEDQLSLIQSLAEKVSAADRRNKEIMKYSKDLFQFTRDLENNVREDWTRSYDEHEDSTQWSIMHKKHHLETQYKQELKPLTAQLKAIDKAYQNIPGIKVEMEELQKNKCTLELIAKNIQREINYLVDTIRSKHKNLYKSIRLLFNVYSYKRHFVYKRNISIFPIQLVFMRNPLLRLQSEYRKSLSAVHREVLHLRNHNIMVKKFIKLDQRILENSSTEENSIRNNDKDIYVRCLVSFYIDDVTKNFVINIQGNYNHVPNRNDQVTTEESCQYQDFAMNKEDCSPMLKYSNTDDIIITKEEVGMLLKTDARYYHIAERVTRIKPPLEFRAPSTFDRDINGIRPMLVKHKFIHVESDNTQLSATFLQRQQELDQNDVETAKKLIRHIRMHIFSHRVCIGMLHLYRRIVQFEKVFRRCLYYNDLQSYNPVTIQHDLYSNLFRCKVILFHRRTRLLVNLYNYLHKFTINLHFLAIDSPLPIYIDVDLQFSGILQSLLNRSTMPLMYITLLKSLVTSKYSLTFIDYLMESLGVVLPGQLSSYYNRKALSTEIPSFLFNQHHDSSYKFMIAFYRFMLNTYIYIKLYRNPAEDIYIEIYKPNNGKFYFHSYNGKAIKLFIGQADLRLMLLKMQRTDLLHPEYIIDLINYLLDSFVYIDFKEVALSYIHSVETAQSTSRPQSRRFDSKTEDDNEDELRRNSIPSPLNDRNSYAHQIDEIFIHLYDHYIRSTTPIPIPSPSSLLPIASSRCIYVKSLPGLSKDEHLVVDLHALKYYLCHAFDIFNHWKENRFESFMKIPIIDSDIIKQLLTQINAFTSYPKYVLHPTSKTSQGNLQMINVYSAIYPFSLQDTKETVGEESVSTHLFTSVFVSDDKEFVRVEVSNLNHSIHGKEIEDMLLLRDREAFLAEDERSRQVIEYYQNKKKVIDIQTKLIESHIESLKKYEQYLKEVALNRRRSLSHEILNYLIGNANRLLAKHLTVNVLFQLLPQCEEKAKAMELKRDIRLVRKDSKKYANGIQDEMYALYSSSGLKDKTLLQLNLASMDLVVIFTQAHYNKLYTRFITSKPLMRAAVRKHQSTSEFRDLLYNTRHPDFWSYPTKPKEKSKAYKCDNLLLYSDNHSRMISLENEDYLLRYINVSRYGIITMNLYHLDSSQDYLIHGLPRAVSSRCSEGNSFMDNISSSIAGYTKQAQEGDVVEEQLKQLNVLRRSIISSISQQAVKTLLDTCTSLFSYNYNYKQPIFNKDDEDMKVLKERLLPHSSTRSITNVDNTLHHRFLMNNTSISRTQLLKPKTRRVPLYKAPKYQELMSEKEYQELMSISSSEPPAPSSSETTPKKSRKKSYKPHNRKQSVRGSKHFAMNSISESSIGDSIDKAAEEAMQNVINNSYLLLFVPLDQAVDVIPIYLRPDKDSVSNLLEQFLGIPREEYIAGRRDDINRVILSHAIAFYLNTRPQHGKNAYISDRNERYYRLVEHFQVHNMLIEEGGYSKDSITDAKQCNGDVLIMLRHNKNNLFQRVLSLCNDYKEEYLPILMLRREKEGRERDYRLNIYGQYKHIVVDIAKALAAQMSAIFNPLSYIKVDIVRKDLQNIVLQLLRWFDVSKGRDSVYEIEKEMYFIIDAYLLQEQDNVLELFDKAIDNSLVQYRGDLLNHPYVGRLFDLIMGTNRNSTSSNGSDVVVPEYLSAEQVLYCMYQQHCYHCDLALSVCRFPGCNVIRSTSRALLGGDHWLTPNAENSSTPFTPELLPYSGKYVLDIQIKQYLYNNKLLDKTQHLDYLIKQFYASHHTTHNYQTVENELVLEEQIDKKAYYDYHFKRFIACRYDELNKELHYLHTLHRLLLLPEQKAMQHSVDDLLLVEGGIHYERKVKEIEDLINSVRNKHQQNELKQLLKFLDVRIQTTSQLQQTTLLIEEDDSKNLVTGKISMKMMKRIVGSNESDPYPSLSASDEKQVKSKGPMPDALYHLLMERVVVTVKPTEREGDLPTVLHRCVLQHGGKDYQAIGELLTPDVSSTAFKRLLHSEAVTLPSGDLIILQVLYGVMEKKDLLILKGRGVPSASLAYISTEEMEERLKPGLTLSVYDVNSRGTCAVYVSPSQIQQLIEAVNAFFSKYRAMNPVGRRESRLALLPPRFDVYAKYPDFPCPVPVEDYLHVSHLLAIYAPYLLIMQRIGNYCTAVEVSIGALERLFNRGRREEEQQEKRRGEGERLKFDQFQLLGLTAYKFLRITADVHDLFALVKRYKKEDEERAAAEGTGGGGEGK